jgi:serine/threonine protein kinase
MGATGLSAIICAAAHDLLSVHSMDIVHPSLKGSNIHIDERCKIILWAPSSKKFFSQRSIQKLKDVASWHAKAGEIRIPE